MDFEPTTAASVPPPTPGIPEMPPLSDTPLPADEASADSASSASERSVASEAELLPDGDAPVPASVIASAPAFVL